MTTPQATETLIRPADLATPGDAAAVLRLLDAYAADPMGDHRGLPASTRERLIPALSEVPGRLVLLAFADGAAVGLAVCFPGFSTFRARPLLNVHDLTVLTGHRRRGIGTALLRAVEAEAARRGCCKLTLEVRADNPAARGLYRKLGFGAASAGGREIQYLFLERRLS
jgi:ribosomal protein S18 acetylase RimI-like enzyme